MDIEFGSHCVFSYTLGGVDVTLSSKRRFQFVITTLP